MDIKLAARLTLEFPGTIEQHKARLAQLDQEAFKHGISIRAQQYPGTVCLAFVMSKPTPAAIAAAADLVEGLTSDLKGTSNWLGATSGYTHYHAHSAMRHLRTIGQEKLLEKITT